MESISIIHTVTPEEYAQAHDLEYQGTEEEDDLTFAEYTSEDQFYTLVTEHGKVDGLRLDEITSEEGTILAVVEGEDTPRRVDSLGVHEYSTQ